MLKKVALITGITGQDGSYLAEFLLEKGYVVHGIKRRSSSFNQLRIEHIYNNAKWKDHFFLHYGDIIDSTVVSRLLITIQPSEIYNLAAQSHVHVSFELPMYTANVDGLATLSLLESVRLAGLINKTRIYQASTSELYGKVREIPQTEETGFYPRSPYAVSKLMAFWSVVNYRESYGMYCVNGILFNHESPRRGETFVSRKITMAVSRITNGLQDCLYLGNLNSQRDWGHAKDYVRAMWMMLQLHTPTDYVIATGKTYTVRFFCEKAFEYVNIPIVWVGTGLNEVGINKNNGKVVVRVSENYFRPAEVDILLGDPTKAYVDMGWKTEIDINQLISEMMDSDLAALK